MTATVRVGRFTVVAALGMAVQLSVVTLLVRVFAADPTAATIAGVSCAVLHNFAWHLRWTWRDRMTAGASRLAALARFTSANGAVSLAGSAVMIPILTGPIGLAAVTANLVTIGTCGGVNYWLGDRVCFRNGGPLGRLCPETK